MDLPLLVTTTEEMPIYLQIFHQLRHLIISSRLPEGTQLPSVRQLSRQLGVNAGTVVQAYRELQSSGLIDGHQGRGTYVKKLSVPAENYPLRQALLDEALSHAIQRARALGFDPAVVRQHFNMHLARPAEPVPVVLLSTTQNHADKYAAAVQKHLGKGLRVVASTIEALEEGQPALLQTFNLAHYVISFVTFVPRVQKALLDHGIAATVLGITAELTPQTLGGLAQLPPERRYALVTEERNINSFLAIVRQNSAVDYRKVRLVLTTQPELLRLYLPEIDTVMFSFGAIETIEQCQVPPYKRFRLEFSLTHESLGHLQEVFESMLYAPPQRIESGLA